MSIIRISTENRLGHRQLHAMSGYLGMGQYVTTGPTPSHDYIISVLANVTDTGTVSTLEALGASDDQLWALANGSTDVPTLMSQLTGGAQPGSANVPLPPGLAQAQQQSVSQTGYDVTSDTDWLNIADRLANDNAALKQLEAQVRQNPALAKAYGQQVIQLRSDFTNNVAVPFTQMYTTVFGSAPAGLTGLGIAPVIAIALVAGFIALVGAIVLWETHLLTVGQNLQAQANLVVAQAGAKLIATGQTAAGTTVLQQLAQPPAGAPAAASFTTWITQNFGTVVVLLVAVVAIPMLIKK